MKIRAWVGLPLLLIFTGCFEIISKPLPPGPPPIPEVSNILLELLNAQEKGEILGDDYPSTSLDTLITLGTPAGFRLKLRYERLGISLVEVLKLSRDRAMLDRLFELVQWAGQKKVRSEALVALGSFADPDDVGYFNTALADKDVGIRCAVIEALQVWRLDPARDLLKTALNSPWSPVPRLLAAQALLSMGDQSGLTVLYKGLDDRSWIVRAMSARYLGDYADPKDYQRLVSAMNNETQNDFVIAETAIAALKLVSKTKQPVAYSIYDKGWRENDEVKYTLGRDNTVEVEPLIIIPPRKHIPESVIVAQSINQKLITLLKTRLGEPLSASDKSDPNLDDLNNMLTPTGFALKTRYSNLSVVVAEGLAGTNDAFLRAELSKQAELSSNALTRATAVLSLGYNGNKEDFPVIIRALTSPDPIVRFGGMEAVQVGHYEAAVQDLITIATSDEVPAFRLYAIQVLTQFNNSSARNFLLSAISDRDWPARAMAVWYLGRYGLPEDFMTAISRFSSEENPFVKAEVALATQRLAP